MAACGGDGGNGMIIRKSLLYVLAALVAVAGVHAWLAVAVPKILNDSYLEREALVSQQFLAGILATESRPDDLFAEPAPSPTLASFAAHVRHMPGVIRANIYSPDGFIRHSTEANLVGIHFAENEELEESFAGHGVASLLDAEEARKDEHLALNVADAGAVLEAYVPVPDPAGRIVAVVEFYRKDPSLAEARAKLTRLVWLAAAVNGALMLGLVLLLFRRRQTA